MNTTAPSAEYSNLTDSIHLILSNLRKLFDFHIEWSHSRSDSEGGWRKNSFLIDVPNVLVAKSTLNVSISKIRYGSNRSTEM